MTSPYLLNPLRGLLELIRDFSTEPETHGYPDSLMATAQEFGAIFISVQYDTNDTPKVEAVSANIGLLTGHVPADLIGIGAPKLFPDTLEKCPYLENSAMLTPGDDVLFRSTLRRKDGGLCDCSILMMRSSEPADSHERRIFMLIRRNSKSEMSSEK